MVILIVLAWGMIGGYVTVVRPLRSRLELRTQLAAFAGLYFEFQQHFGRSPCDLEEVEVFQRIVSSPEAASQLPKPYSRTARKGYYTDPKSSIATAAAAIRTGDVVIVWNTSPGTHFGGRRVYIGYESSAAQKGGFVLFADGDVSKVDTVEFSRMGPLTATNPPPEASRLRDTPPGKK